MKFSKKDIRKLKKVAEKRLINSEEEMELIGGNEDDRHPYCYTCKMPLMSDEQFYFHAIALGHKTYPSYK